MLVRGAIALLLVLIVGYGIMKAYPLLAGPQILIDSPEDGATLPNGVVTVSGTVRQGETLTINGGLVLIDEQGRFALSLTLPPGNAILMLSANDRFGRRVTREMTVYVPEPEY